MHDFTPYQRYPTTQTSATSHAEFLTLASLRYKIHVAVAAIDNEADLRAVLAMVEHAAMTGAAIIADNEDRT